MIVRESVIDRRRMNSRLLAPKLVFFVVHYTVCWICGGLDVTTIYRNIGDLQLNYTSAECHARTDALGLPFVAPNGSTFEPEVGLVVPSCQIGLKPNCPWTSQGWEITGGSDLNLPPLNLPHETVHIHTNGATMSHLVPLFWPRFNFSLKSSTRGTARIFLLTDADIANAELYVLDVVHNMIYLAHQTSSMLKCGRGRQYVYDIDLGPGMGIRRCHSIGNIYIRWLSEEYVMFRMELSGGKMQLWRNGSSTALFTQSDPSPLRVKYIALTTSELKRDWTLYLDGRLWSLASVRGTLKSPILALGKEPRVCVSFFTFIDSVPGSSIKVSTRFHNGSHQYMAHIYTSDWENKNKWILQRLAHHLSDHTGNDEVQIVIEGLKGNPLAVVAVHGLMGCNPDDEEEIAVAQVSFDPSNPFICEVPAIYDSKVNKTCPPNCLHGGICGSISGQCVCPPGFTGAICDEGCGENSFGQDCLGQCSGRRDGCKGLILCVPLVGCNCAAGYSGVSCDIECEPGWYGPNCSFTCGTCSPGSSCDPYTGVCFEGCAAGFYPPLCNTTYSHLLQAPTITEVGATRATFTFASGPKGISGAGNPRFYQVQLKENQTSRWTSRHPDLLQRFVDIKPVTGVVDQLRPGIEYRIRIILIDRDGSYYTNDSSIPFATFTTNCQVPINPKYEIKVTWRGQNDFEVEWKYDPNDLTACDLTHYRVYLKEGWRRYLYNVTKENNIFIPNRNPFFKYSVQLQAVTSHGPSIASNTFAVQTAQGAPSRVLRLNTKQISPTELGVYWKEPRGMFGKVKKYIVEYECLKYLACLDTDCNDSIGHIQTSELSIILPGLHSHAQYSIKVAAFTVERGPWAKTKSTTSFSAPEAAPLAGNESVISRTATTLKITWEPVADCRLLHGFPLHYHYGLYAKEPSEKIALIAEGNVTHPPITFTSLKSYTNYLVQIEQVVTGGLHNPNHKLEIFAMTRGTVSPAVEELTSTDVTSSMVSISWNFPIGIPRDAVKHFVVIFKCLKLLACEEESLHNCTSNGTVELNQTSVSLKDLKSYAKYEISVAAFTGETGNFATLNVDTLAGTPEVAPRLDPMNPPVVGSTWISVSWQPPYDCSLQHGPLLGYQHRILAEKNDVAVKAPPSIGSVFTRETFANFTMLPSFTVFRIEVSVVNNLSVGTLWGRQKILNFTLRTRPKVPNPVEELVAYKHGEKMVGLRWRSPPYLHGIIDSAEINVTGNDKTFVKRVTTLSCAAWSALVCCEINSLEANTTYFISVRPFSSVVQELGLPANVTVLTVEGVSDPPSFARLVRKTDRSLIIEWGHPNMSNGILRSFRILTDHVDSYVSDMCCESSMSADVEVFRENSTYAAQIKGLKPASEYFITVVAVTFAPSSPVTMTIYTKPGTPQLRENPPYVLEETITNTTAEIALSPASDFNGGPIWSYFVMVCGVPDHSNQEDDLDPVLSEVKMEVKRNGFIAITLNDEELDDELILTIGNGEESLGLYGFIRNKPLLPNTTYNVVQIVMSEYMGSRSFGIAESKSFTTRS